MSRALVDSNCTREAIFNQFYQATDEAFGQLQPELLHPQLQGIVRDLIQLHRKMFMLHVTDGVARLPQDHDPSGIAVLPLLQEDSTIQVPDAIRAPSEEQVMRTAERLKQNPAKFAKVVKRHFDQLRGTTTHTHSEVPSLATTDDRRLYGTKLGLRFVDFGVAMRPVVVLQSSPGIKDIPGEVGVHELVHVWDNLHKTRDVRLEHEWDGSSVKHLPPAMQDEARLEWITAQQRAHRAYSEFRAYHVSNALYQHPNTVPHGHGGIAAKVEHLRLEYTSAEDPFYPHPHAVARMHQMGAIH